MTDGTILGSGSRSTCELAAVVAAVCAFGCGTNGSSATGGENADARSGAENADATTGGLTLSLDPSLDQDGDDVKANQLSSANLVDTKGSIARSAQLIADKIFFDVTGLAAGDYFIAVNGDMADLVPTRIDTPGQSVTQRVGQKLHASYIGSAESPGHRINTYSTGPDSGSVVRFSDGTVIPGVRPYVMVNFAASTVEVRTLGSAASLTSLALTGCAGHPNVPADAWLLNTTGQDHHGDLFNADGGATECGSCHADYWTKKPSYSEIRPSRGWCFACHSGPQGAGAGFVDPSQ